jgi:hypothetical protein
VQEKVKNYIKYITLFDYYYYYLLLFFFKQALEIYYHITRELDLLINKKKNCWQCYGEGERELVDMFYTYV